MRFARPLILFSAIVLAALGIQSELDRGRTADRAPASVSAPSPSRNSEERPKTPKEDSAAAASASVSAGKTLWPSPGERWIYRFERKAAASFGGKPWLRLSIGGRSAIEPIAGAVGENRYYLVSFEVDRLEMQGRSGTTRRSFPSARLEIDPAGRLRELRFVASDGGRAPAPTEEEADLVRDLVAQWLFFDSSSRLGRAEIEWSEDGGPGPVSRSRIVTKRIVRYPDRPEITKLDSNHEWATVLDSKSGLRVARIEGNENFTIPSANGDFSQSTSYRWLWIETEKTGREPVLAVGVPFTIEGDSVASADGNPARKKVDPAAVARSWPRLSALDPHSRLKLLRDAKRSLDSGASELVSIIVENLRGKSSTSLEWRTGIGALASSSNPEAAAALLALYREPDRTTDEKLSILSGVSAGEGTPAPDWKSAFESALSESPANPVSPASPSTIDESTVANFDPSRDSDPSAAIREASLYALGSSIRKETDSGRRAELETLLWSEAKEASSDSAKSAVLDAIGNSGSGDFYSYVTAQFSEGSPPVRAKAVAAVRFLDSGLARPILDRARTDPAPTVRRIAEWSESFQK